MHWNIKQSELRDVTTGERYRMVDTGHDRLGVYWDLMNNLNAYNEAILEEGQSLVYDHPDGFMPVPEIKPMEGEMISASFRFIGRQGEVYHWDVPIQFKINANGEVTVDMYHESIDCE